MTSEPWQRSDEDFFNARQFVAAVGSIALLASSSACTFETTEPSSDIAPHLRSTDHVALRSAEQELATEVDSTLLLAMQAPRQSINKVFSAEVQGGELRSARVDDLPDHAHRLQTPEEIENRPAVPALAEAPSRSNPEARIGPELAEALEALDTGARSDDRVEVQIVFREELARPRFPSLIGNEPRSSPQNQSRLRHGNALMRTIESIRQPRYDARIQQLQAQHGAIEKERSWLINSMKVEVPLSEVRSIAGRADVQHIEHANRTAPFSHVGDNVRDGRALIYSDPHFPVGAGYIGVVDSGLRISHTLISNPDIFDLHWDCVNGLGPVCNVGPNVNPDDRCAPEYSANIPPGFETMTWGHGTPVAHIIAGNLNLGPFWDPTRHRGVTSITIDSFSAGISQTSGNMVFCNAEAAGAERGIGAALVMGDHVINASLGFPEPMDGTGTLATLANAVFDYGSLVVAAAGNDGPYPQTVRSPAIAHKALAVGAIRTISQDLADYSSRGPTWNGRIKPDISAPAEVHAARVTSSTALWPGVPPPNAPAGVNGLFQGTSSAAPFATGAAALVRSMLATVQPSVDPGQVMAWMILAGNQVNFNNDVGAGLIELPSGSTAHWGAVSLGMFDVVSVPFSVPSGTSRIDGAIWWPEDPWTGHHPIVLELVRPNGSSAAMGFDAGSVFQKVRSTSNLTPGTWTLRLWSFWTGSGQNPQTVYYAINRQ